MAQESGRLESMPPQGRASSEGGGPPKWFLDDLVAPFRAGISYVFIVHGDVNGLVRNPYITEVEKPYVTLSECLERVFDKWAMVIFYNIASGLKFLTDAMEDEFRKISGLARGEEALPSEPEKCLPFIEKALRNKQKVAVVVNSVHFIVPSSAGGVALPTNERIHVERIKNWAQDEQIRTNGNIVLLITDQASKVSSELRTSGNGIQIVFVSKPTQPQERKEFIITVTEGTPEHQEAKSTLGNLQTQLEGAAKDSSDLKTIQDAIRVKEEELARFPKLFPSLDEVTRKQVVVATQGMSYRQMQEVFLQCMRLSGGVDIEAVKERKIRILNNEYGDVMDVVEPDLGLEDIGGLEHVKGYFRDVLVALKSGEYRLVPMGVTLMGPPGTGKTAIVKALAREAGFNFVKIKNARSMWLGESEARMEKQLVGLRALAPVVVANDEADLNDAGRDGGKGDSGVSERLMKMWMEFLSDPKIRGQIIVVSCTNRPDRIDPALKRSGRSDERLLLPMPSSVERLAIFVVIFRRHKIPTVITDLFPYAEMTDGLSGADIEKLSLDSFGFAFRGGKKEVDDAALRQAIDNFIPNASQTNIDQMTLVGILESSSRRLLPRNVKDILHKIKERKLLWDLDETFAQIKARKIVDLDEKPAQTQNSAS